MNLVRATAGMTMAKGDDPRPMGWDEPPISRRGPRGRGKYFRQLSLGHIMIALVYFALVFWAARMVVETHESIQQVFLAVLIGLGLAAFGLWAAMRMARFSVIGWLFFVGGYMAITGATVHVFAIPSLPILIGAIVYLGHRQRSTNQDALLWVLDVAAERGMPLAPGVQAFAGQASGIFRIWAGSLAELLDQGVALPEAIDSLPKVVPRWASFLIRMGQESGDLAAGLREAARVRSGRPPALGAFGARVAYLGWVVLIGQGIVGFVMYFIIPRFEAIFQDFGVELPEVTILVIRASHLIIEFGWVWVFLGLMVLIYLPFAVSGWSNLGLPLVDRVFPRRHTSLILRAMAIVVGAGRPIGPALRAMAQWYPTGWVRKRLEAASLYADQGVEWPEALHSCGLLSRGEVGVLDASRRAGNLAWAIRELAEAGDRRRGYRLQVWSQVLFVLTILAIGGMVFVIAEAFFMPLTTLILRLAQ